MTGSPNSKPMRFGFYTDTFMYRSEVFFYRQAVGMPNAHVQVLARQGALLDEFPVDDLFLVDEFRDLPTRMRLAIERRLTRSQGHGIVLPRYGIRRLARHLNRYPVDLLYTLFGWNASQLLEVLDLLDKPVPLVFMAPGNDVVSPHLRPEGYLDRLRHVFDRSTVVLALSEFLRERLIELGAPEERVHVHYIGIDIPPEVAESGRSSREDITVLAVSRLHPMKGLPHTIRAFRQVLDAVPGATLEIIGDGEERPVCEQLIERLGLARHVTLHGSRSISEVYAAMARADIFVQHSVRTIKGEEEGLGLSSFEAAAHGLPVVSTRSGGIAEGTVDGVTGILVDPGDESGMAAAVIALAKDPGLRARMGSAGRRRMIEHFDIQKQNEKLEKLLSDVVLDHRRHYG